jgi:hypothetical protein
MKDGFTTETVALTETHQSGDIIWARLAMLTGNGGLKR